MSYSVQLSLRSSKKAKPHPFKCFDWKEVARNKVLSKQFSLEVYKFSRSFQSLCDVSDLTNSLEDTHDSLIACTEGDAKEMLPRKKKPVRNEAEKSTPVANARVKLKEISLKYHKNPSRDLNPKLKVAKKNLDEAYLKPEADFILRKIKRRKTIVRYCARVLFAMNHVIT